MLTLLSVLPGLLLSSRAPPPHVRGAAPRMRDPVDGSPEVGDSVPPELLRSLGVEGKRVALTFYNRDDGHEDAKQLRDFCERAEDYAAAGCEVLAVRNPDKGAKRDETAGKFAALRFVDDEGDAARLALGMPVGGLRAGRTTLLVEPSGVIAGEVTQQFDPYAHSKMCLRVMRELDGATPPSAQAAQAAKESPEAAAARAYEEMVANAEKLRRR